MKKLSEIKEVDYHLCKCLYVYCCPFAASCRSQEFNPSDPRSCYNRIWEDIDTTRLIIQDMTTRMGNDMFLARKLENKLNE